MRSNHTLLSLALGAVVAASGASACKKSADSEQKAGEAELRSADGTTIEAPRPAIDEKHTYLAVVRREQLELRARLQEDLDDIDRRLAALKVESRDGGYTFDPRAKNAAKIKELLDRRSQLEEDALTVERADERGWDELKATVERDLAKNRPRPQM